MYLGVHCSIAGGYQRACKEAKELGCNTLQMFVKNQMMWRAKSITCEEAATFRREREGIRFAFGHDSYLINLATTDKALWQRSLDGFIHELERCDTLGLDFLVMHPGSPGAAGADVGIAQMIQAFNAVKGVRTKIAIETMAGQGNVIGWRFEHLRAILEGVKYDMGVCFDTCHVFAAGYDLREKYDEVMDEFDRVVGLKRICAFHLNDSVKGLGSRVDRHWHIGKGKLGKKPFQRLMTDERFAGVPKVLETPKEGNADRKNLKVLRELAGETACLKR